MVANENLVDSWRAGRSRWLGARNASLIPTWQEGAEAANPSDVARFARDGYEKNSLIYSCIKEKATSFGALHPQVVRADGSVRRDHRMVDLLRDPNPHQDGQEFAEELATQFDAAGNCYVWKVAVSDDPARRRALASWPVQELRTIRPDLVTIVPGATTARDVYVVKVDGRERARIPRSQMIHIREPNLTNDFYGLPKIALLVREGAVDLSMSDFELAFFRNAGVPMGLLSINGRVTPEEVTATKKRFRDAYNGVKRWFDLLVLNSDKASYTPMGLPQNQMEMDSTRYHVESRICSVFGVPGVIVGARYALQGGGTTTTYEDAEHAFWAETMVPFSMRFARAWKKFLLPEFATTRDEKADVTYDFTVVRALQEDRSRKLREVTRLVLTGGFTVNQALTTVGMDPVAGGDFYIRNGNQVVVGLDGTITPMAGGGAGPNLDNPLEGAARSHRLQPVAAGGGFDVDDVLAEVERLTVFRPREGE